MSINNECHLVWDVVDKMVDEYYHRHDDIFWKDEEDFVTKRVNKSRFTAEVTSVDTIVR